MDRRLSARARSAGVALATVALVSACAPKPERQAQAPDTTRTAPPPPPRPIVRYRATKLSGDSELTELENALGAHRFGLFLRVNRVDLNHVRDTDTLFVPDTTLDAIDLSPYPLELASVAAMPKLFLVSVRVQAFGAYESGRLVRWGPASTGKKATPTPLGLYHVNWKARQRYSTVNDEWLLKWCVNIQNHDGISLHEYELPGRPASHSCVRMLADDAEWVYGWVEQWRLDKDGVMVGQGTPVLVFGEYAWNKRAPWKGLAEDPEAASVSLAEVDSALAQAGLVPQVALSDSAAALPDTLPAPDTTSVSAIH